MILSEKIILLRKERELSQEQLAEQLEVSRQAVSKWESGASIPDLDKIIKLSQLFGVSVDALVKDDVSEFGSTNAASETSSLRVVSMEEANAYMELVEFASRRIALGVLLCITSPIALLLLTVLSECRIIGLREGAANGIGVAILLVMVAAAVVLFLTNCMSLSKYEYLEKEPILTAYGVSSIVERKKADYAHTFRTCLSAGVVLCIIGVIPTIIAASMEKELYTVYGVGALLFLVAVGVFLIVQSGMIWSSYQKLLQEGDYTPEHKLLEKKNAPIASIYWCITTAIYLAISFSFNSWDRSWIIWPVAGVLFAAVMGIYNLTARRK